MKKSFLAISGPFLMGYFLCFGPSANAAEASFLGSELSHEQFVTAAKAFPIIRLTKNQLIQALDGAPIALGAREWSVERIPEHDVLKEVLKYVPFEIEYDCDGADSLLEADTFEIDAAGVIRRMLHIVGNSDEIDGEELHENKIPILFKTLLTDEEKKNPLLLYYQYTMTYEQESKVSAEAKSAEKEAWSQDKEKELVSAFRLIKNPNERNKLLTFIHQSFRQGTMPDFDLFYTS